MNEYQSKTLQSHDELLLGRNGEPGIVHKVGFMWRIQLWVIALVATLCGIAFDRIVLILSKATL